MYLLTACYQDLQEAFRSQELITWILWDCRYLELSETLRWELGQRGNEHTAKGTTCTRFLPRRDIEILNLHHEINIGKKRTTKTPPQTHTVILRNSCTALRYSRRTLHKAETLNWKHEFKQLIFGKVVSSQRQKPVMGSVRHPNSQQYKHHL